MNAIFLIQAFRKHLAYCLMSLFVAATCAGLPESARAFSITDVTLTPASPIPAGSNLVVTVNLTTPGTPTWRYPWMPG